MAGEAGGGGGVQVQALLQVTGGQVKVTSDQVEGDMGQVIR